MPRAAAALVFGALLFTSNLAGAAELTGFGPIKFGMSREEALSALEARGLEVKEVTEKDNETVVVYEIPFSDERSEMFGEGPYSAFRVSQVFRDGGASRASVRFENKNKTSSECQYIVDYFITVIKSKYEIEPFLDSGNYIVQRYIFVFANEEIIEIHVIMPYAINDSACGIYMTYFPSPKHPIGL